MAPHNTKTAAKWAPARSIECNKIIYASQFHTTPGRRRNGHRGYSTIAIEYDFHNNYCTTAAAGWEWGRGDGQTRNSFEASDIRSVRKGGEVGNVNKASMVGKASEIGKVGNVSSVGEASWVSEASQASETSKVGKVSKLSTVSKVSEVSQWVLW